MYVLDTYQQYYCIFSFTINNRIESQRKIRKRTKERKGVGVCVGEINVSMKIEIVNNRELRCIFLVSYHYEILVTEKEKEMRFIIVIRRND